jgi:acyl carrier protein|tara:strand:- start:348 stop:560 length:213 start_codon:yes stop_codon:yes gene_type:complete
MEKIIAKNLDISIDLITDESNFINDLGADSLSVVEIIMEIEDAYEVTIPDEDVEELNTVGDLKNYIKDNT